MWTSQFLTGIPNSHLYDGTTSIYHLARQCFGGTIALREHFRCVPEIIGFSNELSYNFEIRPLRNPATAQQPHVIEYVVQPGHGRGRDGKTNLAEARVVVALFKAATGLPEYAEKTFGAICLLGDEQASLIQDLAVSVLDAVELGKRRFVAGNVAQFQGDERDVMFLSMVDAPSFQPSREGSSRLGGGGTGETGHGPGPPAPCRPGPWSVAIATWWRRCCRSSLPALRP